jgi:hypothetical protein
VGPRLSSADCSAQNHQISMAVSFRSDRGSDFAN